tara:strand:- start:484 stop:1158 length:675 start_codon:yes stop_codon:yes gene_type:complete
MNWQDEGFLLSKRKFRENAIIINVFTQTHGKISGIVYGGNSRKIRNYLQVSNKIFSIYNSKNDGKIGYFKTELIKPISPRFFHDKTITSLLLSLSSILNTLLPEGQPNNSIYISLENLISKLEDKNIIFNYIDWELNLLKQLGFDIQLGNFKKDITDKKIQTIKIDNITYKIPNFVISKKVPDSSQNELIKLALQFNRNLFINKLFLPNNLVFPKARILLEKFF